MVRAVPLQQVSLPFPLLGRSGTGSCSKMNPNDTDAKRYRRLEAKAASGEQLDAWEQKQLIRLRKLFPQKNDSSTKPLSSIVEKNVGDK